MKHARGQARSKILESAARLVREAGTTSLTVEGTAKGAGVAKGLVHYHFKTKAGLLQAVLTDLTANRCERWSEALRAPNAAAAVSQSWALLTEESADGTLRAWHSLLGHEQLLTDQLARGASAQFSRALSDGLTRMMDQQLGLVPTVPASEIGQLLAAVTNGIGLHLMAQTAEEEFEGAFAAAWLGILSLTKPKP